MSSYVENFKGKVDFPKPFQRTGKFPLDRTDLFESYVDAVKYAAGNREDPDIRGLCGTSYIGQIITVFENDVVTVYKIKADRTLEEVGADATPVSTVLGVLEAGKLFTEITIPEGYKVLSIHISDSTTGEQVFTDVSHLSTVVTISIAEAYANPLDIIVLCGT